MSKFLIIFGVFCTSALIMALLYKEIKNLNKRLFDILLLPLQALNHTLAIAVSSMVNKAQSYNLDLFTYFLAFVMITFGIIASVGDFLISKFSLRVVGLGDAVIAHTRWGSVTAATVIAGFLLLCQWVLSRFLKKDKTKIRIYRRVNEIHRYRARRKKTPLKILSIWAVIGILGIISIEGTLAYLRTIEMDLGAEDRIPIVDVLYPEEKADADSDNFNASLSSLQTKAILMTGTTLLTSLSIILVSAVSLETAFSGICLVVTLILIFLVSIVKGTVWLIAKVIEAIALLFDAIFNVLLAWGNYLIIAGRKAYGFLFTRKKNQLMGIWFLLPFLVFSNFACVETAQDQVQRTEVILILDTSGSFRPLMREAMKKAGQIIACLPENSELIALKIDNNSYQQCKEIVRIEIPTRSTRQKYAKSAKEIYNRKAAHLKRAAIDTLQTVLDLRPASYTDIWGAIAYASELFSNKASKKILIIMSDFLHNTRAIETVYYFKEVRVWGLFVDHGKDSPAQYKRRISQYRNYFIKNGALSVKFLDPIATSRLTIQELLEFQEF